MKRIQFPPSTTLLGCGALLQPALAQDASIPAAAAIYVDEVHYDATCARNIADARFIPNDWAVEAVLPGPGSPGSPSTAIEGRTHLSDPRTFGVISSLKC